MGSITYQGLIDRVQEKTQTTALSFGNWTTARKLALINQGVYEVHKKLVGLMQWSYFVAVDEGLVPAGNVISLEALSQPFYAILAMSRYPYSEDCDVRIKNVRDIHTNRYNDEGWYEIGRTLRSDVSTTLSGPYRIVYNYRPPKVTENELGTFSPFDDEYEDLPALWAAREAYSDAGFNDHYAKLDQQWERRIRDLEQSAAKRSPVTEMRILDKMGWSRRGSVTWGLRRA